MSQRWLAKEVSCLETALKTCADPNAVFYEQVRLKLREDCGTSRTPSAIRAQIGKLRRQHGQDSTRPEKKQRTDAENAETKEKEHKTEEDLKSTLNKATYALNTAEDDLKRTTEALLRTTDVVNKMEADLKKVQGALKAAEDERDEARLLQWNESHQMANLLDRLVEQELKDISLLPRANTVPFEEQYRALQEGQGVSLPDLEARASLLQNLSTYQSQLLHMALRSKQSEITHLEGKLQEVTRRRAMRDTYQNPYQHYHAPPPPPQQHKHSYRARK